MREVSREVALAIAGKAMDAGSHWGAWPDRAALRSMIEWDVAGKCHSPRKVEIFGANHWPDRKAAVLSNSVAKRTPVTVILTVRCRQCMWCNAQRAWLWTTRAADEYLRSSRTWLATLTLDADAQYRALAHARMTFESHEAFLAKVENRRPKNWEGLRESEQFSRIVRGVGHFNAEGRWSDELANFVKRIRKNSGAPIRYLLVAEPHPGDGAHRGLPHFHMLIHEGSVELPVRKTVLKEAWRLGYSGFKLCDDPRAASYVCKYVADDARTRIRASFRYGLQPTTVIDGVVVGETPLGDSLPPEKSGGVSKRVPTERQRKVVTF